MFAVIHRRKGMRRSHLKRFSADVTHVRRIAPPLGAPEVGRLKSGESMEARFDAFALKARNRAAQHWFGEVAYVWDGKLIIDSSMGKMKLPVHYDPVTNKVSLARALPRKAEEPWAIDSNGHKVKLYDKSNPPDEGNYIPRAAVLFQLAEIKQAGGRQEKIDIARSVVLEQGKWTCVRYFFWENKHMIVDISTMRCEVRRSIVYNDRNTLFKAYHGGNIYWAEHQRLNKKPEDT